MPPVPSALRLRRRWRSLQRWLLSACDLPAPWQETPSLEIWRLPQTTSSTVAPMQTLWVGVRAGRGARWVLACVHRLDRQRLRAPPYNRKQWHPSFYYWRQAAAGHRAPCSATRRCAGASVHAQEHHRCTQPSSWSGRLRPRPALPGVYTWQCITALTTPCTPADTPTLPSSIEIALALPGLPQLLLLTDTPSADGISFGEIQ